MKNQFKNMSDNIEVPDIVKQKAEEALNQIKMEEKLRMLNNNEIENYKNRRRKLKSKAVVVAGALTILVGGTSAFAAIQHNWGRGMSGELNATSEQQQKLTDEGMAKVFAETEDYSKLAVTNKNITIAPTVVVSDGRYARISFNIKGYHVEDNVEPSFEDVEVSSIKGKHYNMCSAFHDGIIWDGEEPISYDDGSPIEKDKDGYGILKYADKNGNIEYNISLSTISDKKDLLGETIHVKLTNLGIAKKADHINDIDAEWDFDIKLPEVDGIKTFNVNKKIDDVNAKLNSVEVSPISIKLNYDITGKIKVKKEKVKCTDEDGNESMVCDKEDLLPRIDEIVMKNGERINDFGHGGNGYNNDKTKASEEGGLNKVVDVDQIKSVIIDNRVGKKVEIPIQ